MIVVLVNASLPTLKYHSMHGIAPIDNTDIPRYSPAIGRNFKFPFDVELNPLPNQNDKSNNALFEYVMSPMIIPSLLPPYKSLLKNVTFFIMSSKKR